MNNKNWEQEKRWLLEEKYGVKNKVDLKGEKCAAFFADVLKLKKGEPLAYVIGHQPFLNCKIDLQYKPLIPRCETEYWVDKFIKEELKEQNLAKLNFAPHFAPRISILDIFSGSGCIGIGILKNTKNTKVDFSEINSAYIKQIKKNISINKIKNSDYKIYQSDVFQKIPANKKYHYILANPPYLPKNKSISLAVMDFEDHNSLFADDDGLFFIKKLILEGPKKLFENGKIYIEFDETSKKKIISFLKKEKIKKYFFLKDQYDKNRIIVLHKK